MEILSISGKKYLVQKEFAPEIILTLLSDDFDGIKLLPSNYSDETYEVIINFFNQGIIDKVNDEITSALDFFGYDLPEFGFSSRYPFPDDYKKIWLEDDWVRNNLDKLADFGDSRLIKLSDVIDQIFNNHSVDNLLDKNMIQQSRYDRLINSLNKQHLSMDDFHLAGGALVSRLFGIKIEDYDFFYVKNEATDEDFIDSFDKVNQKTSYFQLHLTKNSISRDNVQFILRSYRSIAEVVFGFDIGACSLIYSKGEVYMTPKCFYELKNKTIIVDLKRCSTSYEYRLFKYIKKGFGVFIPGFETTKLSKENINYFRQWMKNEDIGVSYCLKKSKLILTNYKQYIELDGLDILLFLLTVKNRVRISDYDMSEEVTFSRTTFTELRHKLVGYGRNIHYKRFSIHAEKRAGISIVPKYNKEFTLKSCLAEIKQEDLLKLNADLNPIFEIKRQNPGEQISGTFHKKAYLNPDLWFGKYFYDSQEKIDLSIDLTNNFRHRIELAIKKKKFPPIKDGEKINISSLILCHIHYAMDDDNKWIRYDTRESEDNSERSSENDE